MVITISLRIIVKLIAWSIVPVLYIISFYMMCTYKEEWIAVWSASTLVTFVWFIISYCNCDPFKYFMDDVFDVTISAVSYIPKKLWKWNPSFTIGKSKEVIPKASVHNE